MSRAGLEQHSTSDSQPACHHQDQATLEASLNAAANSINDPQKLCQLHIHSQCPTVCKTGLVSSDNGPSNSVLRQLRLLDGLDPEQHSTSDSEPACHHQDQDTLEATLNAAANSINDPQKLCQLHIHSQCPTVCKTGLVSSDNGPSNSVLRQLRLLDGLDPEQHSTSDSEPACHHQDQDTLEATLNAAANSCQLHINNAQPYAIQDLSQTMARLILSCASCGFWMG